MESWIFPDFSFQYPPVNNKDPDKQRLAQHIYTEQKQKP